MKSILYSLFAPHEVVNKTGIYKFVKKFAREDNWHNIDVDKGNLGYGWIHYSMIRVLKPKRVLCIGSRYGYIPAICATACRDNGRGVVDFVDASYDEEDTDDDGKHWGGVGFWKKVNPVEYFRSFGIEKYIKLHVMESKDFAKKFSKRKWGYINIDGDHSYSGVKTDFKLFWPKLESKGMMSFHDIFTKDQFEEEYGVYKFWNEISKKENSFSFPGEFGLGLVQK